jgi:hypothetical protein
VPLDEVVELPPVDELELEELDEELFEEPEAEELPLPGMVSRSPG